MYEASRSQSIAMNLSPMVASLLSFISSSIIIVTILRSETKLSNSFRRLFFCLSVYDMIQSLSSLTGVFSVPAGTGLWAIGNDLSCSVEGFFYHLGSLGSPLYSLSITIFFLCRIIYDVQESVFSQKIERYVHIIPNLWSWSTGIFLLSTGNINNAGWGCWIAAYPEDCTHDPDIDCIRGEKAFLLRVSFSFIPIVITFLGCTYAMLMICCFVISRQRERFFRVQQTANQERIITNHAAGDGPPEDPNSPNITPPPQTPRARGYVVTNETIRSRNRQVIQQACLFICAFTATVLPACINRFVEQFAGSSPYWLHLWARTSISMQGFFNIIVYTKPHVVSIRKMRPDISWIHAFFTVVKSGGDNDGNAARRLRSLSWAAREDEAMEELRRRNNIDLPRNNRQYFMNSENITSDDQDMMGEPLHQVFITNMSNIGNLIDTHDEEYPDVDQGHQQGLNSNESNQDMLERGDDKI